MSEIIIPGGGSEKDPRKDPRNAPQQDAPKPEAPTQQAAPAGGSGLHIDSDWKRQAQAEKAKLAEQAKAKPGGAAAGGPGGGQQMPEADFEGLVSALASNALMYLGGVQDPQTGRAIVHLELARHHLDLLQVLQDKTEGNLDEEESTMLSTLLYELRNRYVQIANAARQQAMGQGGGGAGGEMPLG